MHLLAAKPGAVADGEAVDLGQSPGATLSHIEGHDFHGLYPSGQWR